MTAEDASLSVELHLLKGGCIKGGLMTDAQSDCARAAPPIRPRIIPLVTTCGTLCTLDLLEVLSSAIRRASATPFHRFLQTPNVYVVVVPYRL